VAVSSNDFHRVQRNSKQTFSISPNYMLMLLSTWCIRRRCGQKKFFSATAA